MALENRVFSKKDFQTWAKADVVPFAAVMTKIKDRPNDDLLRTYEFRGFPSLAVLDADGEAIAKGFARDLYSMKNVVKWAPLYSKLEAEHEAGDKVNGKEWLMARLGMGKIEADEARTEIASLKLDGKPKQQAEQSLFVMEMTALSREARRRDAGPDFHMEACTKVYDAFKAGRRLPDGSAPVAFFDDMLIDAAMSNKDHKAFMFAYKRVQESLQEQIKSMESRLPRYRADLEKYEDNEQLLPRIHAAIERAEKQIADAKKKLADMAAFAAKPRGS